MKILYLTFYFEPDLCAGSFRNTPLVKALSQELSDSDTIDVITTMPNRYKTFREEAKEDETKGNIRIRRIKIPDHKSKFTDQIKSFKTYYSEALKLVKDEDYTLVFASSSRLFTAYLGYKIAKKNKLPLYLDIRDIFTDTMQDVLKNPMIKTGVIPTLKRIEKKTFGYATHINLISEGFKPYFKQYNKCSYSAFTNGIDEEFTSIRTNRQNLSPPYTITYAGNIGEGQGLHKILPQAAKQLGDDYQFKIIGDGGTKPLLVENINQLGVTNIELIDPVTRKEVMNYYKESDFLFMHLNDYNAFKKVLPSKVFEYGATDKPIIAGVGGYAGEFVKSHVKNSILFSPGDVDSFVTQMKSYTLQFEERPLFFEQFNRKDLMVKMAQSILHLVPQKNG